MIKVFIFGLTLAIAIGPIAILMVNYGINEGRKIAMQSGTGAALADLTYAFVSLTLGGHILPLLLQNRNYFNLGASFVLIGFGIYMVYSSIQKISKRESVRGHQRNDHPLIITYLLTVVNPLTIVAFVGFSGQLVVQHWSELILYALAIFSGSLLVQYTLAILSGSLKLLIGRT